jgi:hypothetical protein
MKVFTATLGIAIILGCVILAASAAFGSTSTQQEASSTCL